jgi:hypothetical protein
MQGIWLTVIVVGLIVAGVVYFQVYKIDTNSELYEGLLYGSVGVVGVGMLMLILGMATSAPVQQIQPMIGGRKIVRKNK